MVISLLLTGSVQSSSHSYLLVCRNCCGVVDQDVNQALTVCYVKLIPTYGKAQDLSQQTTFRLLNGGVA